MCHEVKCSDAMAYTLLTVAKVATYTDTLTKKVATQEGEEITSDRSCTHSHSCMYALYE